jgi:uncharacterized NAD-dependent epimerase/dehydratase family protein
VGKMTAALELTRELERRGARAAFVATGQTGILIAEGGVAVDAVVSDFAAGAIEDLVLEAGREADVVVVEGQGALHHPGYSGVTLALMAGACARALILCHHARSQSHPQRRRRAARDSDSAAGRARARIRERRGLGASGAGRRRCAQHARAR